MCGCQPPFFYRAQADKYQKFDPTGTCILLLEARDILRVGKKQLCEQATGGLFLDSFSQQIFLVGNIGIFIVFGCFFNLMLCGHSME
jgi:hypothetical protein